MPVAPPGNNWFPTILLFSLKCFLCRFGLESTQPGVVLPQLQSSSLQPLSSTSITLQPKACQYFVSIQENHRAQNPLSRKPSLDISCSKNTLISFRVLTSTKSQSKSSSFIFLSLSQSNSNRNSLVFQFHYILFLLDSYFQKIKSSLYAPHINAIYASEGYALISHGSIDRS